MEQYESIVSGFIAAQHPGNKHPRRVTDQLARSQSPIKLHFQPVGRMFFRCAPLLLRAPSVILPCWPAQSSTILVEAYPALVAAALGHRHGYKTDDPRKATSAMRLHRHQILCRLVDPNWTRFSAVYGLTVSVDEPHAARAVADHTGDLLDAVLCCVQAAWASRQPASRLGSDIPCIAAEGWIADPALTIPPTLVTPP
jgi:hypothetical protein